MDLALALVIVVIVVALVFDFTNGFHDAANAIATAISTRALTPHRALILAAVLNIVGALLGTEVAKTIGKGIIDVGQFAQATDHAMRAHGLILVLGGLLGAIAWNLITWWFGLPSSSSHALIGGLAGAGAAGMTVVHWDKIIDAVIIPMFVSPLVGFGLAWLLMMLVIQIFKNHAFHPVMRRFRFLQIFSASAIALGHGLQDAQKTMGVIFIALVAGGHYHMNDDIPFWVKFGAAAAIAAGTYAGGFKIMKTLGSKVISVTPANGFVAESVAASVLFFTAFVWHAPISTTHTITSAIMGVGATRRLSAVRWGMAGNIVTAWVLTLPASGLMGALCFWILHALMPV